MMVGLDEATAEPFRTSLSTWDLLESSEEAPQEW